MSTSSYSIVVAFLGGFLVFKCLSARSYPAALPPGPPGLPIIGNVFDMPTKGKDWLTYAEWGRKWGRICMVKLLGQPIVVVNSAEVMQEMDRQSSVYSDRPRLEMAGELVGYAKTIVIMPYGPQFRNFRKHFFRLMGTPNHLKAYWPMQHNEVRKFLRRILANPMDLEQQLRKTSGAIIMKMAYGITVEEGEDPFVTLIEHANDNFNIASTPGKFMVDVLPILRYIPAWFPGAGFQKLGRKWKKAFDDMVDVPYSFTRKMMDEGTAPVSYVSSALEKEADLNESTIDDIKHVAASMYGGGSDTTVSSQYAFFLAMLLNPDVQKQAQAEIDTLTGGDRLPNLEDKEQLPYVQAVVTEVLRWHNVAPLGVPHRASEDGIIDGYFVPKGSLIILNLWQILHDPEVYPDPLKFDPTRHIPGPNKDVQRDPRHASFGMGRRICPGMHLAEASLYLLASNALATFDVSPIVEDGLPVLPEHENTDGTISHQKPYKYVLKPRSEKAVALINREYAEL